MDRTAARPEAADPRIEVRSFHAVFQLERRIYRVDRLRLNPAGVPVRGVLYFAGLSAALAVAARAPVLGWPLARLPWFIRYLAAPGVLAALLAMVRVDGRPFHRSIGPILRLARAPRAQSRFSACPPIGTTWQPPSVVLVPDGSDPHVREFRYRGPGSVLVLREHERLAFGRPMPPAPGARVLARPRGGVDGVRGVVNARPLARPRVVTVPRACTLVVRKAASSSSRSPSGRTRR